MSDISEKSLLGLLDHIRSDVSVRPSHLVVCQEGLDRMKALCEADPAFRKRVLAEFPQMEGIL
jgi:hypothetical protein